jgi:hypothetical protein
VAAEASRWFGGHVIPCAFLYRSTDRGQTFQPGVQLDTFNWAAWSPHVVADRDHIICDYFGSTGFSSPLFAESRTFYTQADSWGSPVTITNLDSLHELYYSGTLALSGDGGVHTALMIGNSNGEPYLTYYVYSSDHGVSWSDLELVNEDTTARTWYPDIGADSAGHAYIVWYRPSVQSGKIWFATNHPAAIAEETPHRLPGAAEANAATIIRGVLFLAERPSTSTSSLFDTGGREVLDLAPGANDVRALAPGVYFVRTVSSELSTVSCHKVVVAR